MPLSWEKIRAQGYRIYDPEVRKDVLQIAWIYGQGTARRAGWVVADALRQYTHEAERNVPTENMHWIPSTYVTICEFEERWCREENEDQIIEWARITPAERDKRIAESHLSLGTSH